MQDKRTFENRNVGNPTNSIKEFSVKTVPSTAGKSQKISLPNNIGAFNKPTRK